MSDVSQTRLGLILCPQETHPDRKIRSAKFLPKVAAQPLLSDQAPIHPRQTQHTKKQEQTCFPHGNDSWMSNRYTSFETRR